MELIKCYLCIVQHLELKKLKKKPTSLTVTGLSSLQIDGHLAADYAAFSATTKLPSLACH
jgi:hypothetical protein